MVFLSHILRFLDILNDSFFNLNKKINVLFILNRKEFFLIENNETWILIEFFIIKETLELSICIFHVNI